MGNWGIRLNSCRLKGAIEIASAANISLGMKNTTLLQWRRRRKLIHLLRQKKYIYVYMFVFFVLISWISCLQKCHNKVFYLFKQTLLEKLQERLFQFNQPCFPSVSYTARRQRQSDGKVALRLLSIFSHSWTAFKSLVVLSRTFTCLSIDQFQV